MVASELVKDYLPHVLAMLLHIGAAYVVPEDDGKIIVVLDNFDVPPVPDWEILFEDMKPKHETVDEIACFQCRLKVAVLAMYNPEATKRVLCHNCYETLGEHDMVNYKRHLLVDEIDRKVWVEIIKLLKGQQHKFMDTIGPKVSPLAQDDPGPVFLDTEIQEAFRFMLGLDATSVKCNNDVKRRTPAQKKQLLGTVGWKKYYWSTTVDQVRRLFTDEAMGELGEHKRAQVRAFREKVERVMDIMAQHPDRNSITQFDSGRGVLILFGGFGTCTLLHLDISGALTYQFKVSSRTVTGYRPRSTTLLCWYISNLDTTENMYCG